MQPLGLSQHAHHLSGHVRCNASTPSGHTTASAACAAKSPSTEHSCCSYSWDLHEGELSQHTDAWLPFHNLQSADCQNHGSARTHQTIHRPATTRASRLLHNSPSAMGKQYDKWQHCTNVNSQTNQRLPIHTPCPSVSSFPTQQEVEFAARDCLQPCFVVPRISFDAVPTYTSMTVHMLCSPVHTNKRLTHSQAHW
jgi:hypothetical protein